MKKLLIKLALIVCCSVFINIQAEGKQRNILQEKYSEQDIRKSLTKDFSWVKFPKYRDRKVWEEYLGENRNEYIRKGEKYLGYSWPYTNATTFMEFSRTGERTGQQEIFNARRSAFQTLVMAELAEGKGRFLDDIINGVFSYCEQTYWGYSAHFYLYRNADGSDPAIDKPTTIMPNIEDPIIDLGVGEVAADLAWSLFFFKEEFNKVSPVIAKRLTAELKQKVIEPYYSRDDYWWITGWGKGRVNNWTPWCTHNVLQCVLLVEENEEKKVKAIMKSMKSVDLFLNTYEDDGACSEGPSYWSHAGGKMFEYLDLLKGATQGHVNIFDNALVKNMGKYIYRVYVANGNNFVNFADAPAKMSPSGGLIYRYGKSIGDSDMCAFGAFLIAQNKGKERIQSGSLYPALENIFNLNGLKDRKAKEPLIYSYYFPDLEIAIAREKEGSNDGFYFAAKGGSNGEQHNHNDVGSFILFYNGKPVFVDAGVGTYSAKTFSSRRYDIWTMQSLYHNVPVINGIAQKEGGSFKATQAKFNDNGKQVGFSVDLAKSYPSEASVDTWLRSYKLERGKKFVISDNYKLKKFSKHSNLHFMTDLDCKIVKPGVIEMTGPDFSLEIDYDAKKLKAKVETITIDDQNLIKAWGNDLKRLVFELNEGKLSDAISITIKH